MDGGGLGREYDGREIGVEAIILEIVRFHRKLQGLPASGGAGSGETTGPTEAVRFTSHCGAVQLRRE